MMMKLTEVDDADDDEDCLMIYVCHFWHLILPHSIGTIAAIYIIIIISSILKCIYYFNIYIYNMFALLLLQLHEFELPLVLT